MKNKPTIADYLEHFEVGSLYLFTLNDKLDTLDTSTTDKKFISLCIEYDNTPTFKDIVRIDCVQGGDTVWDGALDVDHYDVEFIGTKETNPEYFL